MQSFISTAKWLRELSTMLRYAYITDLVYVPKTPTKKTAEALNCKVEATQETISFGL
jgi:hypothetical protein